MMKSFTEAKVWQKSHQSTLEIYKITARFPKEEIYGIISQMRRASASIGANIAEGFYRNTTKELINFLYMARGSSGELIYFLILARDLGYIDNITFSQLKFDYDSVAKQLNGWIKSLQGRKE
jgi:four helix bundle protein